MKPHYDNQSQNHLSLEEIQTLLDWAEMATPPNCPKEFRESIEEAILKVVYNLNRQKMEREVSVPTLAIEKLKEDFPNASKPCVKNAIDVLRNPRTEDDLKFVQEFGALQAQIEWVQPFRDGLFNHINEVPTHYREQVSDTIHHEINLVLGSQNINSHDDNFAYVHDLKSILDGSKTVDQVGGQAARFCGGRGVLNSMLREEAGDLESALTQRCEDFIDIVGQSMDKAESTFSMER